MIHCAVEASMPKSVMIAGSAGDMTVWFSSAKKRAEHHDSHDTDLSCGCFFRKLDWMSKGLLRLGFERKKDISLCEAMKRSVMRQPRYAEAAHLWDLGMASDQH